MAPLPTPTKPQLVREPAVAGSWYSDDPAQLAAEIDGYLSAVQTNGLTGYPIALIAPHAGHRFSGPAAAYAYYQLKGRTYNRVFILGPSHRAAFRGIALPEYTHYKTPLGLIEIDQETVAQLRTNPLFASQPGADAQEHCIEIQLPFLQRTLARFRLVPLLVSNINREEVLSAGETLRKVIRPGDLVVVSTDFTHYGPSYGYSGPPDNPIAPREAPARLNELLDLAWTKIESRDLKQLVAYKQETGDTICGFLPILLLNQLLPSDAVAKRLTTATSGQMTRDWRNSVSYLAGVFTGLWPYLGPDGPQGLTPEEKAALLKLARYTVEQQVNHGRRPTPDEAGITLTERLKQPSGSFVTLKENGELRGCIGNMSPDTPLYEAVIDNAISAAIHDRRFDPVSSSELSSLEVEVSVLTPPVPVASPSDIILGKHGIYMHKNRVSGVFLPQVAPEQGWTLEQTLQHLSNKIHFPADAWKTGATFEVFEAIVFHEER